MDQLILLGLPVLLLLFIISSSRRRQKEAAATQRSLQPGVQVITTAGLYAQVVEVEDVAVVLEASPGVRTRWARGAVARVVADDAGTQPTGAVDAADGVPADPAAAAQPVPQPDAPGAPGSPPGAPRA